MSFIAILFYLIAAHALLDFPLQGDAVAINKNRHAKTALQNHVPWYYWMGSHALVHGAAVGLITNNVWLGFAETVCHFVIDYSKCEKAISIHMDQFLHVCCKLYWATWVLSLALAHR